MTFDDRSSAEVAETLFGRRDVMEQLVARPMDKSELIDATETSRSTVSRALKDLQTVDLVERTNGDYAPTPYGEFIYDRFVRFADAVELGSEIRTLLPHLPLEYLDFDPARLIDAEVTFSSRVAPAAPLERVAEMKRETERARTVATGSNPEGLASHYDAVVNGGQRFETVCPSALIEVVAEDATQRDVFLELLEHDRAEVFRFDEPVPIPFGLLDETAFFGVENEQGSPLALIETTDPHVRRWAEVQFDAILEGATRLTADEFERDWPT